MTAASLDDRDKPTVATSGTIDRDDKCGQCGEPMLYRVEVALPLRVRSSFCQNFDCGAFLLEIEE